MIDKHEQAARDAAAPRAPQVICFQELFYGPYFCQVQDPQYYDYTEQIPDGPTTQRFQALAKELGMVMVLPMYEIVQPGPVLQHRSGHRRRRHLPRQVPQAAHPADQGLLGEVLLHARHRRVPGVRHRGRQGRRLHLLRPPLPRGLAGARPQRRRDRVQPVGHAAAACSEYIWRLEQPAAAVANMYYVGAINRVGIEELGDERLLRAELLRRPGGQVRRRRRRRVQARADRARPRPGQDHARSATAGRSTATAAPTPTTSWSRQHVEPEEHMARTLIKNGKVVSHHRASSPRTC